MADPPQYDLRSVMVQTLIEEMERGVNLAIVVSDSTSVPAP